MENEGPASSSGTEVKLRLQGLTKRYGNVDALIGADLEVRKGECVTLLGPSGSGKTTLLNIIAGLLVPDAGEIWIENRRSTHLPPYQRDIGVVFQNYALFPHLTVFENVAFPLRMRRVKNAEVRDRVRKILAAMALPDKEDRLPSELSGGQQQRIALARALVYEPPIVLMDEPLAALDKKLRDQLQLEIRRFQREFGITMLYVTHDQQEALLLSDRICLMNQARIEQLSTPAELYFQPRSVFASDFVGESNLFEGTVRRVSQTEALIAGPAGVELRMVPRIPLDVGERLSFVIRPERIRIGRCGAEPAAGNQLAGKVADTTFLGDATRYYVEVPNWGTLTVKVLTDPSKVHAHVGDRVLLDIDAASIVALRSGGSGGSGGTAMAMAEGAG